MPRPIIGLPQTSKPLSVRSKVEGQISSQTGPAGPQLQMILRQKRSKQYLEAINKIDAGAHQSDRAALTSLIEAISAEFPELRIDQLPLGIVSRCYLGSPFEVHICDLNGDILEHFETFRSMPAPFERARSLALHPAYAFVEVYSDTLRAVASDGSVSVIDS
jgi:hypothetical protein